MSGEMKYGALWFNISRDGDAEIIYEYYAIELDKIFVVYKRNDGNYSAYSYVKGRDWQLNAPNWSTENDKQILSSFDEAIEYLKLLGLPNLDKYERLD